MKKLLITALLSGGIAAGAYAQGLVALDNDAANQTATPTSTSGGLFFLQATPGGAITKLSGDFNAAFYGGTDSANLSLIASFSGAAAVGSSFFGDGTWTDPNGKTYTVPGLENAPANSSGVAFFKVEAWTGAASSYLAAIAGGAHAGASAPFSNPWASLPNLTPDLTGMPSIVLTSVVPEPGTFALAGLGAAALLIFRRRK